MRTAQRHLDLNTQEPRWFAVYTRYKCEKRVAEQLTEQGIEAYLPIQTIKRRYTRKVKTHLLPLISCYVFVKITTDAYPRVLDTQNVVDFVRFERKLTAIPEEEMTILRRVAMEDDVLMGIQQAGSSLEAGDPVEIIAGALTGLKGTLISVEGKHSMRIELEQLGYTLSLRIAPEYLQKLPTYAAPVGVRR